MSEAPGDVFSLEAANVNYPLANYLEILPDPTGQLTIEDVASEADSFQRWLRQALKRIGFAVLRAG